MMRGYSLGVFFSLLVTNTAFAEPKGHATHPIPNEPFTDFRIDQCEATRGFGTYWHFTAMGPITVLSDICIDEETGTVTSYEPRSGYTLVEKSKNGKILEIIDSSREQALRTHLRFTNIDCTDNEEYFVFNGSLTESENLPDAHGTVVGGCTIPPTPGEPSKTTAEFAYLSLHLISQAQFEQKTIKPEPGYYLGNLGSAGFVGKLTISDNSGTFLITEGAGHSVGDAAGTINLKINSDGTVSLSGEVNGQNQRLAGHKPGEWKVMTAEIPFMRGHLLGADGNSLKAYGFAKGSYENIDGETHQFHARADFQVCFDMNSK